MKSKGFFFIFSFLLILSGCVAGDSTGSDAYSYVEKQVAIGPRFPGSDGHSQTVGLITDTLIENGWEVNLQYSRKNQQTSINIVGKLNWDEHILLGAHFDTREFSDEETDPIKQQIPVMGANDGASGTAVLLELSDEEFNANARLVFFDQEDQGSIGNSEWVHGSTVYVEINSLLPSSALIIDMIGDADLQLFYEGTSSFPILEIIWEIAESLGYEEFFIPETRHFILDDHTPFRNADIQAGVLIDFDYKFWHTNNDILENVSRESLEIIKNVLLEWLNLK